MSPSIVKMPAEFFLSNTQKSKKKNWEKLGAYPQYNGNILARICLYYEFLFVSSSDGEEKSGSSPDS